MILNFIGTAVPYNSVTNLSPAQGFKYRVLRAGIVPSAAQSVEIDLYDGSSDFYALVVGTKAGFVGPDTTATTKLDSDMVLTDHQHLSFYAASGTYSFVLSVEVLPA